MPGASVCVLAREAQQEAGRHDTPLPDVLPLHLTRPAGALMQLGMAVSVVGGTLDVKLTEDAAGRRADILSFAGDGLEGAVLFGRLHYRPRGPDDPVSDAAFVLAAYSGDGERALERLEGEFSLVVWSRSAGAVLAMRDPLGGYPLFWTNRGPDFAIGSGMAALLAFRGDAALDHDFLADYLTRPLLALDEPPDEATSHVGVRRVLPGTILTFPLTGGAPRHNRYWDWRDRIIDPGTDRTEEIAEQVDAALRAAIRERMHGRVASHFSGGMDSTAIALVARDERADRTEPVHALSFVYDRLATLREETPYIQSALQGQAGLVHHPVPADDLLAFDSFGRDLPMDEPFPGLRNLDRDRPVYAVADEARVNALLTGEGGDDLFEHPPFHIADLIRSGRLLPAWRESRRSARAYNTDAWRIFWQFGAEHLVPTGLRSGLRSLLQRGRVDWRAQGTGTVAPWISADFARRHDMRERSLRQTKWLNSSGGSLGMSAALAGIQCRVGDRRRWTLAAPLGMTLSHPFLDPRLLRLGLGIRQRYRQEPGQQKPILAHAMRNVLPPEILKRRAKGSFNEVYYRGLVRNRPLIERIIRESPVGELGMMDQEMLIECVRQTSLGVAFSVGGSQQMEQSLSLAQWLHTVASSRGTPDVRWVGLPAETATAGAAP